MQQTTPALLIISGNHTRVPELDQAHTFAYHLSLTWDNKPYISLLENIDQVIESLQFLAPLLESGRVEITSIKHTASGR